MAAGISELLPFKIALIGVLGIGAQWLAWRIQKPAIVLMAIAGLIFGPLIGAIIAWNPDWIEPVTGLLLAVHIDPVNDFGELLRPMIGIAVAIILFEGGLTLRFSDLRDARHAVVRMVVFASPIAWILGTTAAHYILGVKWDIAAMIGGLFVVTGPTVIIPLLRQAKLAERPASILKWEGIVNDPLGALYAVAVFEFIVFTSNGVAWQTGIILLVMATIFGAIIGYVSGRIIAWAFSHGHVPEYLKAPVMLAWVLIIYVLSNKMFHEVGLMSVTVMGVTMANLPFAAVAELRRFKENIAVLLVSGIFVILTATLDVGTLQEFFDPRIIGFVLVMMFLVRPIAVLFSTLFSGISIRESLLIGWIAPRGVVAVAVAGFFAAQLNALGRPDGLVFVPVAFALVFATVLSAGFTIGPVARLLGLSSEKGEGVLIVGANPWSLGFAKALKDMNIPVQIADTNWRRLRGARLEGHTVFYGEVLSEAADHNLDHSAFAHLIAATPNDAYNALVCVEFAPELGRHRVFQISGQDSEEDPDGIVFTARGRPLATHGRSFDALTRDWWSGWRFRATTISDEYTLDKFYEDRGENIDVLAAQRPDGSIDFLTPTARSKAKGSTLLSFGQVREAGASRSESAKSPADEMKNKPKTAKKDGPSGSLPA